MPTSGDVNQVAVIQRGSGQTQADPQSIPVPPGEGWSKRQIVTGFLAASASFTNDPAVAREFLAPGTRWVPGGAAAVVRGKLKFTNVPAPPHIAPGTLLTAELKLTGQRLATLTENGQLLTTSGSREADLFTLIKVAGQWRISRLPSSTSLILSEPDFQRDYQPRNLYFFAPSGAVLVPDPAFVPQSGASAELATELVRALLLDPTGWLDGAAKTDFPNGTTLLGVQIIGTSAGTTAVVDLGGAAASATASVRREMAAQLVWTLTSSSYSPSAIRSVQLEINRHVVLPLQLPDVHSGLVPATTAGAVDYLASSGGVMQLPGAGQPSRQVPWPAGSRDSYAAVAVAPRLVCGPTRATCTPHPGGAIAGIIEQGSGCTVYSGLPRRGASVRSVQLSGGTCTSLSWDDQNQIWVAVGTHVWMLPPSGPAIGVLTPGVPSSDIITSLRVAPDGVRVAMIVRGKTGPAQVLLGAITITTAKISGNGGAGSKEQVEIGQFGMMQAIGSGLRDPMALSWYDADHVLVLARADGSQLYDVPLNGGPAEQIFTQSGTDSITAAGSELVAGTVDGKILMGSGPNPTWQHVAQGRAPAYPG